MNNAGQKIVFGGICRPDGAWLVGGVLATKMPLLTELGGGINDMSAKSQRFQLGWLALCEKADGFFPLLPKVIKSKQFFKEELRDFPIFEEIRKDTRCKKFLPKEAAKEKRTSK